MRRKYAQNQNQTLENVENQPQQSPRVTNKQTFSLPNQLLHFFRFLFLFVKVLSAVLRFSSLRISNILRVVLFYWRISLFARIFLCSSCCVKKYYARFWDFLIQLYSILVLALACVDIEQILSRFRYLLKETISL